MFAVENHALEDAVYEGLEGGGGELVSLCDGGEFGGVFLGFKAGVAVADGGLAQAFAGFERADVFGDGVALVHELGVGRNEADELLAAHLLFARPLLGEAGDEGYNVVVIDDGGGEEHELEVDLGHGIVGVFFAARAFALLIFEFLGGFQILAFPAAQTVVRQHLLDGDFVFLGEVGVLVELGFEALDLLETLDEDRLGGIALQVGDGGGRAVEALGLHEGVEFLYGGGQFLDDDGGLVHEPDFAGLLAGLLAGEEGDGGVDGVLLLAEVEDVAVGLGGVEHAVGAGEGLDQAVVLEVLVHVERVQVFGIKAGEQHVHDDGDVDFLRGGVIGVGPLLVFDALLDVLIVEIELGDAMVGAVAGVVLGEDGLEGGLFLIGLDLVVGPLLGQVFLDLPHIGIALGGRGEDAGDGERFVVGIGGLLLGLQGGKQRVVFDGVVDGGGR